MTDRLAQGPLACDTFLYWTASHTTTGHAEVVLAPPHRASRLEADSVLRRLRRTRAGSALGRAADLELNAVIWRDWRRSIQARQHNARLEISEADAGRAIAALAAAGRQDAT